MKLLEETLDMLSSINKTTNDVSYVKHVKTITDSVYNMENASVITTDWNGFTQFAKHFTNYDNGYGGNEVPRNTFIIFEDKSWLQRYNHDGSEGWEYMQCPVK